MMSEIYVFGDSTAQGIYLDENGSYRVSRRGCIRLLKKEGYPLVNYAVHGYTVRQGLEAFRETKMEPGSRCLIEFAGNDCDLDWDAVAEDPGRFHDGKVPLAEFRESLEEFVTEARERGVKPILVTPLPLISERYYAWVSRNRNAENILAYLRKDPESISRWQERYAGAVREAAARMNCALADLRAWMLDQMDYPALMCMDGIHPNEAGQEKIAGIFRKRYPRNLIAAAF